MAGDNAQEKSEENSINSAGSKSAACSRECLQFEWLDNMSKKLHGASVSGAAGGLGELTITSEKLSGEGKTAGEVGADPASAKAGADVTPGKLGADATPGKAGADVTPGKLGVDAIPGKAGADPVTGKDVTDRSPDKPKAGQDSAPVAGRDLRKEIIHLAEYGHCTFADRNEYRDTLDKVLKEFSEKTDVSDRSKMLQQMVADFMKNPNQESYADFYKQFNKFFIESGKLAMETAKQLDAEKEKNMTPERKAAEAESLKKNNELFKELDKLPKDEKERIICLMDWQDEVSRDERNERVREGMAKYPELLKAFNASEAADGKRDAMRSAREAELAQQHRQHVRDNILARSITSLMLHRSRIA